MFRYVQFFSGFKDIWIQKKEARGRGIDNAQSVLNCPLQRMPLKIPLASHNVS